MNTISIQTATAISFVAGFVTAAALKAFEIVAEKITGFIKKNPHLFTLPKILGVVALSATIITINRF